MAGKSLIWSSRAKKEFRAILGFYSKRNDSEEFSRQLANDFRRAIQRVRKNENIGQLLERENVRFVVIYERYQLFYRIEREHNTIVTIWDARRDPESLLF